MVKMKKYLVYAFLSAVFSTALQGCTSTSSEHEELASATELKFAAFEDTRASITTNNSIKESSFAVYGNMVLTASSNNPTIAFDGTKVTYNGTNWQYENIQYWMPGHTYSFGAIHPAENSNVKDVSFENGTLNFTYNYPEDYRDATDILTSVHRRSYTFGTGHPVAFNFRHTLSRINFIVKVDQSLSTPITIEHLSLKNVGLSSSYSVTSASLSDSGETDDYIGHKWSEPSDQTGILFDINTPVTIQPGETYEFFKPIENPLMLIPQSVSEDAEMEITYLKGDDTTPINASAKIYITTVTAHNGIWQPNQSYTYSFSIGATDFIIFGVPTVNAWNEEEGGNYVITD